MSTVIYRRKSGKKFTYYKGSQQITDKGEIERINKLVIPPAWQEVEIASSRQAEVQAKGRDAKGRIQTIYSEEHTKQAEQAKFERILGFAEKLPTLRKHVEADMRKRTLCKEKVLAVVIKLMDEAYFRVGNDAYRKQNNTYGITTLRSKHVDIGTTKVVFDFTGKSGKHHHKVIRDRTLANILKQLDELPGYEVFTYVDEQGVKPVTSSDVNTYIHQIMGDAYTAKDFRTWGGTLIAASNLALLERASTEKERKKHITQAVKQVAKRLGNTPAVARSSYINPRVLETYMRSDDIRKVYDAVKAIRPKKYRKSEEEAVLRLLRSAI